jgi:biopolymer transport protein TolQ
MDIVPQTDFWTMISGATIAVKLVLLLLVGMSIFSWTVIFTKIVVLGQAQKKVVAGLERFENAVDLAAGLQILQQLPGSPLFAIGSKAVSEYKRLDKSDLDPVKKRELVADTLRRVLRQGVSIEMKRLGSSISFLATCANAAPFIGLFGTVWGIMHAFHSIGAAKSAALATVAPAISEALVATAIGLGVAIPATLAYNYFQSQLMTIEGELINFAGVFLNRVEREIPWTTEESTRQVSRPRPSSTNLLG